MHIHTYTIKGTSLQRYKGTYIIKGKEKGTVNCLLRKKWNHFALINRRRICLR